jgi:hypothetical protein
MEAKIEICERGKNIQQFREDYGVLRAHKWRIIGNTTPP